MRLIKCHVENFGKLADFDFDFAAGLNTINQTNGWGKSTLATFIKAMFYGLPSTQKRNLAENVRKKYWPWQGGNYGGNLIFALGDKQYKIERFFGKNNGEDTFKLFELATGKVCHDFTANLGEEIFDLDEAAFERSIFIPQKILDSGINESIAQKLTNLIQGTNEDFNCEKAQDRLKEQKKVLNKQIQNKTSEIESLTASIRDLENTGRTVEVLQQQVAVKDAEIAGLLQKQSQIKQQINEYGAWQDQRANYNLLNTKQRQLQTTQTALQTKQAVLNRQPLNTEEQAAFASDYTAQRYQALTNYFNGQIPTMETAQAVYQDVLRVQTLKAQTVTQTASNSASGRRHQWLRWGLLALALLGVLGGVVSIRWQLVLSVGLFILGGCALLAAGYLSLVHLINVKTSVTQKVTLQSTPQGQAELQRLQAEITAFLSQYENADVDDLTAANRVLTNLREYSNVSSQMAAEVQTLQARFTTEQQDLLRFKADKHFDMDVVDSDVDMGALLNQERDWQNQIDAQREDRAHLIVRINKIQDDLPGLADLENEKANLQSELEAAQQSLSIVNQTMSFLQAANESMNTKFLAPMKNGLNKYLTMMTEIQFDNLNLDTDFHIAFEEYGQLRELDYYSQGYQDLLALCMRFALIDTLFKQEKPFIVLDDPLVNLDDVKVEKTKAFLQKLAQEYQLIYFSCHQSRC